MQPAAPPLILAQWPSPAVLRLRGVHRVVAELRRGTPVLLRGDPGKDEKDLVMLAAETGSEGSMRELLALAAGFPVLLLAPVRAAALLRRPIDSPGGPAVAFRIGAADMAALRGMADPTAPQVSAVSAPVPGPVPALAGAALGLAKLARLLPAVVAAPMRDVAGAGLLEAPAADVLAHPDAEAGALVRVAEAAVPLEDAPDARIVAFRAPDAGVEHLAIVVGQPQEVIGAPLVRLHSECFTGDLLGSLRCDCGPQLRGALRRIGQEGVGIVLYMAQEGRGIGIAGKLRAYALQDRGMDTLDANRALGWHADERNYLLAATMLRELGVHRVRLLTNNPDKMQALAACGVEVVSREPLQVTPNGTNDAYLATKARRFGHLL